MVEPDWVTELVAITVMNCGRLLGGTPLLPGRAVHVPLQAAGLGLVEPANPLKLLGGDPPLVVLF